MEEADSGTISVTSVGYGGWTFYRNEGYKRNDGLHLNTGG